jgi:hypothetical protein
MKYICFGYLDLKEWGKKSESEQNAAIDACFAYDTDVLKKNGHWVSGEGIQGPDSATSRTSSRRSRCAKAWATAPLIASPPP